MFDKTKLIIAFGSNFEPQINIAKAKQQLSSAFETTEFSSEIWTDPINIKSEKFINCIAIAETSFDLNTVLSSLKDIEDLCGNTIEKRKCGKVIMDVDILKYGDTIMHNDDWKRPYIIQLLKELNINIK
ncbi:2-amino-4-hydroxy-6-hydroxymethyldihydropteridine diphosphokinase [Prevotella sp.]|uniref:2-amino-4-hydroxy-6- hydroxymethyldihydropteridine diphosphokinase n=1 Tax=Prevotella sp. TaxID=59823 RepID=UPI003DA34A0B